MEARKVDYFAHFVPNSRQNIDPWLPSLSADGPDVLAVHVALLYVHGLDELHGGGDAAAALSLNLRHQLRPCGKWNRKLNGEPVESSCPINII